MTAVAAIAAVLAALWIIGHRLNAMLEGEVSSRYRRGPGGIIAGAEEIVRQGTNGAAVLLVHGGGDTPQSMRNVADELARRGYSVDAPLLPGHGRSLTEFANVSADEWYAFVQTRYAALTKNHDWVGVMGLSMGAAISVRLAAENSDLPALVLGAPYLSMPGLAEFVARTSPIWRFFFPSVRTASKLSILDPAARAQSIAYGAMTARSLHALDDTAVRGRAALPRVRVPTLVIQSTTDNRVSRVSTESAFAQLGSVDKRMEWVSGAGHVITADSGWENVVKLAADWMDSHRG